MLVLGVIGIGKSIKPQDMRLYVLADPLVSMLNGEIDEGLGIVQRTVSHFARETGQT